MAYRFVDSERWKDPWFGSLSPWAKMIFIYMLDMCDSVGIYLVNDKLMGFHLGEELSLQDFRDEYGKKLVWLSDEKVWLYNFIFTQYKKLNHKNQAHRGMMKRLIKETESLPLEGNAKDLIESFKTLIRPSEESQPTVQSTSKSKSKLNNNGTNEFSSTQRQEISFNPEFKEFEKALEDQGLLVSPKFRNKLPEIFLAYGNLDRFSNWFDTFSTSKTWKSFGENKLDQQRRYLISAILDEAGVRDA